MARCKFNVSTHPARRTITTATVTMDMDTGGESLILAGIVGRIQEWLQQPEKEARVDDVNQLPPAADGRQYRYEVVVRLDDGFEEPPTEDEVQDIADAVLESVEEIDHPDWQGADELYIQIYAPDRDYGTGSCGSAHWVEGGFESVDVRPFMF